MVLSKRGGFSKGWYHIQVLRYTYCNCASRFTPTATSLKTAHGAQWWARWWSSLPTNTPIVRSSLSSCKASHHHLLVRDSFTEPLSLTHATHSTYSPSTQDAASLAPSHPPDTVEHSGPFGPRWKMQNLQLSLFLHCQTVYTKPHSSIVLFICIHFCGGGGGGSGHFWGSTFSKRYDYDTHILLH